MGHAERGAVYQIGLVALVPVGGIQPWQRSKERNYLNRCLVWKGFSGSSTEDRNEKLAD